MAYYAYNLIFMVYSVNSAFVNAWNSNYYEFPLLALRQLVGFRYGKKHFEKIVKNLVTVLLSMTLCLCIYFVIAKNSLF